VSAGRSPPGAAGPTDVAASPVDGASTSL
jgi:hypothetical protein